MNDTNHSISRRLFLKKTACFSALATLGPASLLSAPTTPQSPVDAAATHVLMLGDWGSKSHKDQQRATASSMQKWVEQQHVSPKALLMLGDNWYGTLSGGVGSERWKKQFEDMYPVSHFPGPAYAVLGNHDYEHLFGNKVTAELEYSKGRSTRWTMPDRWYSFTFPSTHPLITFICLDSNLPGTKDSEFLPWSFTMSIDEQQQQDKWLRSELEKPRTTPFLAVVAHHPLYSNGAHRDNHLLIAQWDALFRKHKVDFYFTGHDHDLQHLEFEGHPTSFVISGGGGAELVDWTTDPSQRGPWGSKALGFTDLQLTSKEVLVRHIGVNAEELYSFSKSDAGKVTVSGSAPS